MRSAAIRTRKPNNSITRAEFVTIIVNAFHLELQDGKSFADTSTHWAKSAIATASSHGIVTGLSDSKFAPDEQITREQMAAIIVCAAKLSMVSDKITFKDSSDISGWANTSVATARANGLISGYVNGTFRPKANATRAEAATVILKAIKK
ncbi:S-layer homology domain-containing protein [Paenibacillus solisilvae]|uniref:S-layer homology domain-containing protein n=1 Tax=Paenibacillus solisilvae TaxID=2486751 RepID=A0ABW0W1Q3_9BACL